MLLRPCVMILLLFSLLVENKRKHRMAAPVRRVGDEPAGHDGGPELRIAVDDPRHARAHEGTGHLLAHGGPRALQRFQERAGRPAQKSCEYCELRRCHPLYALVRDILHPDHPPSTEDTCTNVFSPGKITD